MSWKLACDLCGRTLVEVRECIILTRNQEDPMHFCRTECLRRFLAIPEKPEEKPKKKNWGTLPENRENMLKHMEKMRACRGKKPKTTKRRGSGNKKPWTTKPENRERMLAVMRRAQRARWKK